MQLDKTHIVVKERPLLETFDLSLHVVRAYFGRLVVLGTIGALPFLVINHLLLGWIVLGEDRDAFFYVDDIGMLSRFVWSMAVLVAIEAPLGSALITAYIGQALFVERPSIRQLIRDVWKMMPRLLWCQLIVRGVLAAWFLLANMERYGDFDPSLEIFMLGGLAMYLFGIRLWRPFINEIILLERNPLFARDGGVLTVGRRSQQLHGPSAGDLFFRGLTTAAIATCLTLAVFGTFLFGTGVLFNNWTPGPQMVAYAFPLTMWMVAGFITVVRFLSYLDLRIRHEGWEIELRLRAEGERLAGRLGPHA